MAKWYEKLSRKTGNVLGDIGDYAGDVASNLSGRPQARAARNAANIQKESADKQLALIEKMYNQGRETQAPWLESAKKNLGFMDKLMGQGYFNPQEFNFNETPQQFSFNEKMNPFSFQSTPMGSLEQDPGYQWRLNQGVSALDRSAARNGGLRSGGMSADLLNLGQNLGSQEFQNMWNRNQQGNINRYNQEAGVYGINADQLQNNYSRALGGFGANQSELMNRYNRAQNIFNTNQNGRNNYFNQLSSMSGREGADIAANAGNLFAQNYGNVLGQGANAQAAGLIGSANAKSAATQNLFNLLMQGGGLLAGTFGGSPKGMGMFSPQNQGLAYA